MTIIIQIREEQPVFKRLSHPMTFGPYTIYKRRTQAYYLSKVIPIINKIEGTSFVFFLFLAHF